MFPAVQIDLISAPALTVLGHITKPKASPKDKTWHLMVWKPHLSAKLLGGEVEVLY